MIKLWRSKNMENETWIGDFHSTDFKQKVFKNNIVEEIIVIEKDGWDSERATEIVDNVIDNFSKGDKVKISIIKC
jgi:thiamine pyrophosphokinase